MLDEDTKKVLEGFENEGKRKSPPDGFPAFPVIPGGRYTDPDFQELEKESLWNKTWLYACHLDEIPEVGSYILWNKLRVPILIIRSGENNVKAFYNTCRHRGGPVDTEEKGKSKLLVCSYHGWSYDLEGNLVNLRDPRDFVGLDKSC